MVVMVGVEVRGVWIKIYYRYLVCTGMRCGGVGVSIFYM